MKHIKTILVDDEPDAINLLKDLLVDIEEIEILATAKNVNNAYQVIIEHEPDLIFLDIQMPEQSGFELVKKLQNENIHLTIIFVTAFDEFAIQAIKHAAFDFLLKPIDRNELAEAIKRFKEEKQNKSVPDKLDRLLAKLEQPKKIRFNTRTGYLLIDPEEIVYCESDGNYSDIHLTSGKKEIITCNLRGMEEKLPAEYFFRISRFNIVNLKYLARVDRKSKICELSAKDTNYQLHIPKKRIKELEKVLSR